MKIACKNRTDSEGGLCGIVGGKGMEMLTYILIYIFQMLRRLFVLFLLEVIVGCYGLNRIHLKMLKS